MSKNLFPKIIEQLKDNQDWRAIVFRMASVSPSITSKAIDFVNQENFKRIEPEYMKECRSYIREGLFFQAIKHYREKTKCSLREAKDNLDKIREEMGLI